MIHQIKASMSRVINKLRNGILQMLSASFLNKIVAMAVNMVISRLLSASGYGLLSYIFNIYGYINLIEGFGLLAGVLQYGTECATEKKESPYFKYGFVVGNIANLIIITIVFICVAIVDLPIEGSDLYLLYYSPIIFFEYTMLLLMNYMRCQDDIIGYSKALNLNTILTALGTCVGAIWGINGVIIGKYFSFIATVVWLTIYNRHSLHNMLRAGKLKDFEKQELWKYSLYTGITSALNCMLYLIDVSMVGGLLKDTTSIGVYKIATLIPNALIFVPNSVIISILPKIIIHQKDKVWLRNKLKSVYLGMAVVNFAITMVIMIFSDIIIKLLAGKGYEEASYLLRILIIGFAIDGTFKLLSVNVLAALKKIKFNLFISILTILCDIAFNIIFIKKYQMQGAASATLFTELVASMISVIYMYFLIFRRKARCMDF